MATGTLQLVELYGVDDIFISFLIERIVKRYRNCYHNGVACSVTLKDAAL